MYFALALLASCLAIFFLLLRRTQRQLRPSPPGPPAYPIIGHARQLSPENSWRYYSSLKERYGDIVQLSAFGQRILILSSYKAVDDLLIKRASIYSDRPRKVMVGEIMGFAKGLIFAPYGADWRLQRRMFHQHLNKHAVQEYWSFIQKEARAYVPRLHKNQEEYKEEFRLTAAKLILGVTYGLKVDSMSDKLVNMPEITFSAASDSIAPGLYTVDLLPILRHLPSWFPGAGFQRIGTKWASLANDMITIPFELVKKNMAAGTAIPSFTSRLIEAEKASDVPEMTKMWLSGSMYGAGARTTMTAMMRFILAMVLHPEIQRKAQDEVDRVVSTGQLPNLSDKGNMPYINAVIQEVFRWELMLPVALPHSLTEDDEYQGYFLKKGTMVIANSWIISRDPEMYPEPEEFIPERFLPSEKKTSFMPLDPRNLVFGYGRRICPGMHFAEDVLWSTIVAVLATTTISKARDEAGVEITPSLEFEGNTLSSIRPFPCHFEIRSAEAYAMVQASATVDA